MLKRVNAVLPIKRTNALIELKSAVEPPYANFFVYNTPPPQYYSHRSSRVGSETLSIVTQILH